MLKCNFPVLCFLPLSSCDLFMKARMSRLLFVRLMKFWRWKHGAYNLGTYAALIILMFVLSFCINATLRVCTQTISLVLTISSCLNVSIKPNDGCIRRYRCVQFRSIPTTKESLLEHIRGTVWSQIIKELIAMLGFYSNLLSSAEIKLLCGLYLAGLLYILQSSRSRHGSSVNPSCSNILSIFINRGL